MAMQSMNFDPRPDRQKNITLENGNVLRMEAKDPYGFIYFSLEHGQLPAHLNGAAFTDWPQAEMAAKKYQNDRAMAIAESVIVEAPVAKKK